MGGGPTPPNTSPTAQPRSLYQRPLALFYLPQPPRSFQPMHDFRRLPGAVGIESPALRLEISKGRTSRVIALRTWTTTLTTLTTLTATMEN